MKLSLYGNQPIITPRDPQLLMEAANKNYVDNSIFAHANNFNLHLTPAQNTFLDSLTVTAEQVNSLAGITTNIQAQLDAKLDKSGGIMTGVLVLASDPGSNLEAATKQYVDAQIATRVSKAGDTMTGFLTLHANPTSNLHAAPKQYVDVTLAAHASDDNRHLLSTQKTFLDNITVTATEVNQLSGITSNVQTQLNAKFDKTGGLITGDVTLDTGKTIFISKVPVTGTEVVNKSYVDSLLAGQKWQDPVTDINLVSDNSNIPPSSPVVGDVYIIGSNPVGAWAGKAGYAVYWNGTTWVELQGRAVAVGDRFGVALITTTAPTGTLTSFNKTLVTITNATPGNIQYIADVIEAGSTTLVFDPESSKFGVSYTRTDEGTWVPTNTSVNIVPGDGLSLDGNIFNVNTGNGLAIISDIIHVDVAPSGGLNFSGGKLQINLDGNSLTTSGNGIKISNSVLNDIADRVSKTASSTVTGSIVIDSTGSLKSNATPLANNDVVTKGYVDSADTSLQSQITSLQTTVNNLNTDPVTKLYVDTQLATKVSKSGDTMTGFLTLHANPTANLHAATKQYVDTNLSAHTSNDNIHLSLSQKELLNNITVTANEINQLEGITSNVQSQLDSKLNLSGGTLTGALTLASNPSANLHAATKQYVDNVAATKVSKDGDTMTGPLTLSGDPTQNLHASTKKYVDDSISNLTAYVNTQDATKVSKAGDTMTGPLTLNGAPTQDLHASTKKYVDDKDSAQKIYIDNADAALQSQITSLQSTVNSLTVDPVTKSYVDSQLATKLDKSGGAMTGYITLHADPQQAMHPATKQYVDAVAQGLTVKPSVRLATTTELSATYNNGTFGVNSTLTGTINGALVVDGKTVVVGDRILVKNQSNAYENGSYVVQQVGNSTSPFILKRVETLNESNEIPGSYFYVYDGDTLKGTGWVFTVDDPITFSIGIDNIYVNQFSGQGSIIAGAGLTLNGNTIDINTANPSRIVVNADNIDLATTGVVPGTYTKVTVDGYGRITHGQNPNTIAGYGITDAQPLNANLTSLSNVTTNGILVRDSTNTIVTKNIITAGIGLSVTNGSGADSGNITINSNATSAANPNTLVSRDASGNFSANIISANLVGNASTATALETYRDFSITGDVTASAVAFNGSSNVTLNATLVNTGVAPGTYTKVTVDAKGRVISATNPTTISGYGVTDVYTKAEVDAIVADLQAQIRELHLYILSRI